VELRQLRYFIEIADQGSFTRASEELSVAQPALSAQIHKLEAELDASLFVRNAKGIVLTDIGRVVLTEARKTVDAADATVRAAALACNSAAARLVLAYTPIFPFIYTARIVRSLRRERPNIQVDLREMSSGDQVPALSSGAIDLAFLRDDPAAQNPGLVRVPVAEEMMTVAFPSAHPLATRRHVSLADLANEAFVMPNASFSETVRDEVIEACRQAGFTPRVTQEASDIRILLGLVSAGLGISILSSAARNVKIRGVSYVSISPKIVVGFSVLYRRGFGGKSLAPFLARIHEFALE